MKTNILRNILVAGLASAAFASCAPIKTQFSDRYAALGAVAEFEHLSQGCADGGAEGAIVADSAGNAFLVRSECEDIAEPELLNPEEIESSPSGEELEFREEIFEMREEGSNEESREEAREELGGESLDLNEAGNAEIPRSNTEIPKINTEVPKINTEVPKVNTEVPKVNTEVPRTNTEVPRTNTEVPKANTEVPRTSTEVPKPSSETRI